MDIGYKIFKTLILPMQRLPLGFHYAVGRVVEWIARSIVHYRKDVITINLARSFPEKKYDEIRSMVKDFYRHFGEIFAETMWFGGCSYGSGRLRRQGLCHTAATEELVDSYNAAPSLMLLDSHFGNWELSGAFFEAADAPLPFNEDDYFVVYKKVENKFWDEFFRENRKAPIHPGWNNYLESHNVLRHALENRGKKKVYVFITDQCPYKNAAGCDVGDFMNQSTLSMFAAAALARKCGMAVYEMCSTRESRGKYLTKFVKICDDASKLSAQEIMTEYYRILETEIRRDPANYLWSHKRWKKVPNRQ